MKEFNGEPLKPHKSIKLRRTPTQYLDFVDATKVINETKSFSKLVKHQRWQVAMKKEMESISKKKTWDLMDLHVGNKLILGKWVYKLK